ncbi:MscL family protein [Cohaesibacter sp. CAU 1516]|uniref:MscL family protein n=1 Tax=Cohaesibacter sp. CAU 1516 TaxID=2576038 RepID=UPI0010FD5B31|nr:MscL family protein [Cohaesibacter sp. CAU 1516]TLP49322.1 MscL family protein [Cohaesibacter sp. CAU 1516]
MVAEKAGSKPASTYLRELALERAAKQRKGYKPAPVTDHKALAQVLALLGQHKLVNAFKQSEQKIEDGVQPADDETILLLRECRDLLSKIHRLLVRALGGSGQ